MTDHIGHTCNLATTHAVESRYTLIMSMHPWVCRLLSRDREWMVGACPVPQGLNMTPRPPTNRLGGCTTGSSPTSGRNTSIRPFQRRLLVPLTIVLLLLVGGIDTLLLDMSHDDLDQVSRRLLEETSVELEASLTEQSKNLEAIERVIIRDKDMTLALQAQDRDALLEHYESLFVQLQAKHAITHFYFHRPDRVNLLRVHKPEKNGDLIERFTLREAERTSRTASGIELGLMGTFTLRVVVPIFDDGTLIGYLELGKEIEDVLDSTHTERGIQLAVTIHKTFIQREAWEAGMKMLGREGDWNRFAADAVIYTSLSHFPEAAGRLVGREARQDGTMVDLEIDGNPWHVLVTPLVDEAGVEVGELFALKDVSEETAQFNRMIVMSLGMAIFIASLLVVFLYFALRQVDRGIEMQRELETRHHEIAIVNASLEAACQTASSATRAKSDFLANMSHEIRTPMTAILGFAENLLDTDQSDSEKLNCVHTIRRNGEYLLGLINDILDLSKIEAGKMVVEHGDCQPCLVIAEVASLMRVRADAKGLPLNIEYVGAIPEIIQSDPTRLRQILINLIGNSIKFTEVGAVRLVTRFVDRCDLPYLQFDVIDTGRGMTHKQVANLFQPFVQADTSTTRTFGGTGLGLTISKCFADLLGGDITVAATEIGVGTTFRVTIGTGPLHGVKMLDDPMSVTVVADTAGSVARVLTSDLQGLRILLAEDNTTNQVLVVGILKHAGAEITAVKDGQIALDAVITARDEDKPFDVILMDMQMPVMDGYEATGKLRRKDYNGLIIALTAHAMSSDREKCIKAGCDDYVAKPIDRKKLIETIQHHLAPAETSFPMVT